MRNNIEIMPHFTLSCALKVERLVRNKENKPQDNSVGNP